MKILLIEDEKELRDNIVESLTKEQFVIETASDYWSAYEKANIYEYDCILLDLNLPNGNGLEILKELKKSKKKANIIIISARNSLDDKLEGLDLGADDFLPKPFHIAELNARIRAVLRRNKMDGNSRVEVANLTLLSEERRVLVNGSEISLNRKEYDILNYFLFNKKRLITRTALAEYVWGDHIDESDNFDFIYSQIKNLRKKLQAAAADIEIEAVYGVGYKLIEK